MKKILLAAVVAVALAVPAQARAQALCASQGVVQPIPPVLFSIADTLFGEGMAAMPGVVYRCVNDVPFLCMIGNGNNCDRPNTSRRNYGADQYCRKYRSGIVPMAYTGHDTAYGWSCVRGQAVITYSDRLDVEGFRADFWIALPGWRKPDSSSPPPSPPPSSPSLLNDGVVHLPAE
jgi:hypothetical protein